MNRHTPRLDCVRTTLSRIVLMIAALISLVGRQAPAAVNSVLFDGVNDYISFGVATNLGGRCFTVECWFKRTGPGVAVSTGTGGITAVPLVTKGRGEADGNNKDMNYFLGIRSSDSVLVADFEEGATGTTPGLNHPVVGVSHLSSNVWYHAAAAYDGTNFSLYLNGQLETNIVVGQPPRWDSIQHAAVGSALNSAGTPSGYFKGYIDSVRVWSCPRTHLELKSTLERENRLASLSASILSTRAF